MNINVTHVTEFVLKKNECSYYRRVSIQIKKIEYSDVIQNVITGVDLFSI